MLAVGGCKEPPLASLKHAQESLKLAAEAGAIAYAESDYRKAEDAVSKGWAEMGWQNGRLAPLRDYTRADSLFRASMRLSENAAEKALSRRRELSSAAKKHCDLLASELERWREALDGSLTNFKAVRFWKEAELGLATSRRMAAAGQWEAADREVERSHSALAKLGKLLAENHEDEKRLSSVWKSWVNQTVEQSRRDGTAAVVVDKMAHKLYLYKAGRVIQTYTCEVGYNSAGNKMFAGDGATPEGLYKVTAVKERNSKYYKALLLNYPNDADKRRFEENKRKGIISKRAGIGKLIEIHGDGGQNSDWTDGCVALTNDEMDQLMKYVKVGTPVTIVRRLPK